MGFFDRCKIVIFVVTVQITVKSTSASSSSSSSPPSSSPPSSASRCGCGFTVNDTTARDFALFTDLLETDFLHLRHLPNASTWGQSKYDIGWQPQVYNTSARDARGPFGKLVGLENVIPNPIYGPDDWTGPGVLGGDPGLQIWVREHVQSVAAGDHMNSLIGTGELASLRDDMLYGSFRVGLKTSSVNGTCGAFFWFHDDQSEIDLEFLSSQLASPRNNTSLMNLVVQTPLSASLGYNAAPTPNFKIYPLAFSPATDYHEYRFDWLPGRIDFWVDGVYVWSMTDNVPSKPGRLFLNHWSNGDAAWSGGPPLTDAVLTISYVKAYFNTSDPDRIGRWEKRCDGMVGKSCEIPPLDPSGSISPLGNDGGQGGRTPFFTLMGDVDLDGQITYPAATPGSAAAGPVRPQSTAGLALGIATLVALWAVIG